MIAPNWCKRLRELYLVETPKDGAYTKSITFNWGKFEFKPINNQPVAFYLATQKGIEEFIILELARTRRQAFEEAIAIVEKELPGINDDKYRIRKQFKEKTNKPSLLDSWFPIDFYEETKSK